MISPTRAASTSAADDVQELLGCLDALREQRDGAAGCGKADPATQDMIDWAAVSVGLAHQLHRISSGISND